MRCRWRILVCGVQGSSLQVALAARSFAIAFDGVYAKLFAGTSTSCDNEWSPWPFLVAAVVLVVAGILVFLRRRSG